MQIYAQDPHCAALTHSFINSFAHIHSHTRTKAHMCVCVCMRLHTHTQSTIESTRRSPSPTEGGKTRQDERYLPMIRRYYSIELFLFPSLPDGPPHPFPLSLSRTHPYVAASLIVSSNLLTCGFFNFLQQLQRSGPGVTDLP
eukprot:GHVU01074899.1.p1 GENE.GHVU01074899.1~~GHVU01074899.1.p1  ORF type:complete len:142 (-),score=5.60 GHVU01074899.1:167-592(-)